MADVHADATATTDVTTMDVMGMMDVTTDADTATNKKSCITVLNTTTA